MPEDRAEMLTPNKRIVRKREREKKKGIAQNENTCESETYHCSVCDGSEVSFGTSRSLSTDFSAATDKHIALPFGAPYIDFMNLL